MADEPNPQPNPQIDTLMRVKTELTVTRAQHNDLTLKIRQRELVDRRRVEAAGLRPGPLALSRHPRKFPK